MKKQTGKLEKRDNGYCATFERVLPHAIEKVWNAITDPEALKYWFTDIEMDFRPGGQITFIFRDDARTRSHGEILKIEAPHRFVWTWEGELAEWELTSLSDQSTLLRFTYSKVNGDYALNVAAGFDFILDLLEESLIGKKEIYPFGASQDDPAVLPFSILYAANTYPTHPELVKQPPVEVVTEMKAPADKVWKAVTTAEAMKAWFFPLEKFEATPGFKFSFNGTGPKGEVFIHHCVVLEVVPAEKLQFSWIYEGYSGYSIVTITLSPKGSNTEVKLTHHGLETFPQATGDFARENFEAGWNEIIGKMLASYFE